MMRKRIFCKSGDAVVQNKKTVLDKRGCYRRVPDGETDLYMQIQASARSCDINYLVARYASGEVDVLSKVQGAYGDFTKAPKTYAEMLNNVLAGERLFNDLPTSIKEKFGNNLTQFMESMGTEAWFDALNISPKMSRKMEKKDAVINNPEVKGDEKA